MPTWEVLLLTALWIVLLGALGHNIKTETPVKDTDNADK